MSRPQLAHYSYILSVWLSASFLAPQLQLRDELLALQLQFQLQSSNSPELITWM